MFEVLTERYRLCDGINRRNFLRAGYMALGGLSLADLLRLRSIAATTDRQDTAVILFFLVGGPSHLEMYDLKPDAPTQVRGPFRPIKTNVPGLDVCEYLPLHARIADKFTLIRSCSHGEANHCQGIAMMMSGYGLKDPNARESDYPEIGAGVQRVLGPCRNGIPTAMAMGLTHYYYIPSTGPGYWGNQFRPPMVDTGGLRSAALSIDGRRLDDRQHLLGNLDHMRRGLDAGGMEAMDEFQRQALEILTTGKARDAFDLAQEDPKTRERYGEGWGQQALLARRLIEAGATFVTVSPPGGEGHYNWDDHAVNWDMPRAMLDRLPGYDRAVTALIEDLYQRGLDRRVLLVVMGEFGRTPRLGESNGHVGRDHWPNAMSILVSGGGKGMGQVIGATNSKGEHPIERPLSPHDILATMYHHLGIDHRREFLDNAGRPIPLTRGTPLAELS